MFWIVLAVLVFGLFYLLAVTSLPLTIWIGILAVADIVLMAAGMAGWLGFIILALTAVMAVFLGIGDIRRKWVSGPALSYIRRALPPMSQTERDAIEAGTVWWDAELFRGNPDWSKLLSVAKPRLSKEEQSFLDGPTDQLCAMLDDWQISHELRDFPPEVWAFMKDKGFFGMIIPKSFGGLEFSAFAHSRVIQKVASRSGAAAVTVMVPNSLGPAELLLAYGTDDQKNHYLPRLAKGLEIPCFALTGPLAGSDAGAIPDTGIVCEGTFEGRKVLGMRLNWEKRYITLGPVATVLGLAFHAYDPDHLLGEEEDLGITCALIPTDTKGVEIGRRHDPLNVAFMNGPNWGRDVFMPLEWVIGGQPMIGKGWRMLVERLSIGRGISLPSLSAAAGKLASDSTGTYARLRKQFRMPVGRFEGVQEAMARIGGLTYMMDATTMLTTSALDMGEKPAVITAIAKRYLTESMRQVVNDAMDVHGGRGICMGPSNYLGRTYQSIPVAITVEGANILTRSMMIFGQGSIRCHPWLQEEMEAASMEDGTAAVERFDAALMSHMGYTLRNVARAFVYSISGSRLASSPVMGPTAKYFRQMERFSAGMSAMADVSLLLLGGALKRKEAISGRFADALGYLYLCSAILKRYEDEGRPADALPLVSWGCEYALFQVQGALDGIMRNFPNRLAALKMRLWVLPWGRRLSLPSDHLNHAVAELLMQPSEVRQQLVAGIYRNDDAGDPLGCLHLALQLTLKAEPVEARLKKDAQLWQPNEDYGDWLARMESEGRLTKDESDMLRQTRDAVSQAIHVDDFSPEAWKKPLSSRATAKPRAKKATTRKG
ncbi:MAG TPA: acyl-CoA dehydrogenase, partial [Mariprofundaceae bacterium]|nr:acyl-CoA dehydrogenase [Mariprofundaceae bacterium]